MQTELERGSSFRQQKLVLKVWAVISLTRETGALGFTIHLWTTVCLEKPRCSSQKKNTRRAGVSWCLVPPNLVFQKSSPLGDGALPADREKFVWFVHFTITTFHLHAFFYTCLCLPPGSFSLVSKHLLIYIISSCWFSILHECRHAGQLFPPSKLCQNVHGNHLVLSLRSRTHPCCVGLVAGPLSHC